MNKNYLVKVENISKIFGGTVALNKVNFAIKSGEVHILLGENGAGKSTLMKIISGIYVPSSGKFYIRNKEYNNLNPKKAQSLGISIIHQELSLVNELSVAENIFIGRLPIKNFFIIDKKKLIYDTKEILKKIGLELEPEEIVGNLKISHKQLVEIARALSLNAEIIIMDEPTSSLTYEEVKNLFKIIKHLKKQKVGIVYVSHKLEEVMEIGDRVTVLKDGNYVGTEKISDVSIAQLIRMIVGKDLITKYSEKIRKRNDYTTDKVHLEVKNLIRKDNKIKGSFKLYKGEILGFFGLVGSGRTEMARAIIGADPKISGQIFLNGKEISIKTPYNALKFGIGLIPENRAEEGLFNNFPIWKNISLPKLLKTSFLKGIGGLINKDNEFKLANNIVLNLDLKCDSIFQEIDELSGGNQQKVVVGKWLEAGVDIYIFDEPTKGIDVGVKQNIYELIRELAKSGRSIIFISSELPELLSISDRILVFKEGKISATVNIEDANKEDIMYAAAI